MSEFGFTDDFCFDLWAAINDAKSGRLAATKQASQQSNGNVATFEEQF